MKTRVEKAGQKASRSKSSRKKSSSKKKKKSAAKVLASSEGVSTYHAHDDNSGASRDESELSGTLAHHLIG